MALWHQDMYIWLGFSHAAAKLLIREQGLDSPDRLRVLTDKNFDDICNVMRKPGGKNDYKDAQQRATGLCDLKRT